MKTKAVRLYGESDLRLEEFDMGELKDDEILMELITDSVCMSTYKESIQGAKHQRVNDDISEHPIIVGHECAGIIREVGAKWKDKYKWIKNSKRGGCVCGFTGCPHRGKCDGKKEG